MQGAIPDQDKPRVVGHLAPFMEIEGDGVGALDPRQTRRQIRREHAERAVGAIHVEPHLFPLSDTGDGREIVDRADIHRAGSRGDEEGSQAGALYP